jgi:hypothetical protein
MIIMLSRQSVLLEILGAVRIRAAERLQVPHSWVKVSLEKDKHLLSKATYHPVIELEIPSSANPTTAPMVAEAKALGVRAFTLHPEQVHDELIELISMAKKEIEIRLAGIGA